MIAIFFALSQEMASLKPQVNILKKIQHAHTIFYQSEFCGFPITLIQTGIGSKNVPETVQHLLKCFSIQLMISSGFAGSLNPDVCIGDLIIGKHILHSSQEIFEEKIQINSKLTCDPQTVGLAVKLSSSDNIKAYCGDIFSVDKIIHKSSAKKFIGVQTSAIAVDMESFAIAERANAIGIPFVSIRAVSDGVDEDMEIHENMVTESGNVNKAATARYLLNKPHRIPYLNRLRKHAKLATNTLSTFFPNFITQIYNSLLT